MIYGREYGDPFNHVISSLPDDDPIKQCFEKHDNLKVEEFDNWLENKKEY